MDIRYAYDFVPTIRAFARSDAFIRGLMGPFGSGKSSGAGPIEIVRRAKEQPPGPDGIRRSQWAVIRNTYPQLRDTTLPIFHRWLPPAYFGVYHEQHHEYHVTNIPGCDVVIKFRALDRPDQVANLLSSWYTGAWVNEAREIPWAVIAALQGRVGRYQPIEGSPLDGWSGIFMDTNPPDVDSWWYELFEEHRIPFSQGEPTDDERKLLDSCEVFKQPGGLTDKAENLPNLKPQYYQSLIMDDHAKRIYIDGQYGFLLEGKPVYPEYKDDMHCKDIAYIPRLPVLRSWDFGLTPACVIAQTVGGRINVIDELCADHMGADRFADDVLLHCKSYKGPFEDVGDPSGMDPSQADEKTCFQILQGKGIQISGGGLDRTTTQNIELRTGAVRKGLTTLVDGRPMLMIDPKAKRLRKGFAGAYQYRRLQVSAERYTDKPDKGIYSHPHNALEYRMVQLIGSQLRGGVDPGQAPPSFRHDYNILRLG